MDLTATFAETVSAGTIIHLIEDRAEATLSDLASFHDFRLIFRICRDIRGTNASSIPMFRTLLATKMLINAKEDQKRFLEIQSERRQVDWVEADYSEDSYWTVTDTTDMNEAGQWTSKIKGENVTFTPLTKDQRYLLVAYPEYKEVWTASTSDDATDLTVYAQENKGKLLGMRGYGQPAGLLFNRYPSLKYIA